MAKYNFTMLCLSLAQFFMFGLLTDIVDLSFSSRVKASDRGMLWGELTWVLMDTLLHHLKYRVIHKSLRDF